MTGNRVRRLMRDVKMAETARAARTDLDVHDADLHEDVADPSQPHEHDGVTHAHANPFRSGDGGYTADRIGREWTPLLQDLLELEAAGALGGIRAIIAERLRQVRESGQDWHPVVGALETARMLMPDAGLLEAPRIAALLAAEIDRLETGGTS